ncbi:MAG: NUDIX domain-containing protein [Patescibacteria group bacterium]
MHKNYLSDEDFLYIYSRVPRLCVDVFLRTNDGVLFALRDEEPYKNEWNLPGGTVYREEKVEEATVRIMKRETGLDVIPGKNITILQFPQESRAGTKMHTISIAMECHLADGADISALDSSKVAFFKEIPKTVVREHADLVEELMRKK